MSVVYSHVLAPKTLCLMEQWHALLGLHVARHLQSAGPLTIPALLTGFQAPGPYLSNVRTASEHNLPDLAASALANTRIVASHTGHVVVFSDDTALFLRSRTDCVRLHPDAFVWPKTHRGQEDLLRVLDKSPLPPLEQDAQGMGYWHAPSKTSPAFAPALQECGAFSKACAILTQHFLANKHTQTPFHSLAVRKENKEWVFYVRYINEPKQEYVLHASYYEQFLKTLLGANREDAAVCWFIEMIDKPCLSVYRRSPIELNVFNPPSAHELLHALSFFPEADHALLLDRP